MDYKENPPENIRIKEITDKLIDNYIHSIFAKEVLYEILFSEDGANGKLSSETIIEIHDGLRQNDKNISVILETFDKIKTI